MSAYTPSTPKPYRETAVLTASPVQLVVMQYDGARRFLQQAQIAKAAGEIELSHRKVQRAEAILNNLRATLDMTQGEIAERLEGVYVFCLRHLSDSRFDQGTEKLEQVGSLLGDLREAWAALDRG